MGTTVAPAAQAASTSRWPGSEMAGVPASVQSASSSPAARRSRMGPSRASSSKAGSERKGGAGWPRWAKSCRVRRVSSATTADARRSTSAARGERSPRLPIGVATTFRSPGTGPFYRGRPSASKAPRMRV